MISVSGKKWKERVINKNLRKKIQQDYNFSEILSQLIVSRNFDKEEIYLINNHLELSGIFRKNKDFSKSTNLILDSIKKGEKVCILGDYDVDGSTATSLLVKFFDSIKHPYFYYIPDRITDGYGASIKLFNNLILKKPKLVIMVDCGSNSVETVDFLNKKKIKSLIIDHHEIFKPYPKANVIINPKKNNGYIKYEILCATSLTYFLLEILVRKLKNNLDLKKYLIYVLLATICDVMPLRRINRIISINALKTFKLNNDSILSELFFLGNKNGGFSIDDLGYFIGPILNAGGRLGKSSYATELLSTNNIEIIKRRSRELIKLNEKRKKIESIIIDSINFNKLRKENKDFIIYYDPNLNEGLIGIIAARLKDFFDKPAIVITKSNNILKGSARSINQYNIGSLIKKLLDEKIILSGGGHNMAGGFTLRKDRLVDFENFTTKDFTKKNIFTHKFLEYDFEISSTGLNSDFFNEIKKIGPFGTGNPLPTFLLKNFKVLKVKILNNKHVSCILKSNLGFSVKSICFHSVNTKIGEYLLNYKNNFHVVGQINENFYNNKKTLQLIIKDLIL